MAQDTLSEKKYSPEELKEDVKFYKKILDELHPGKYLFNSRQNIDETYLKILESITQPLTSKEFFIVLNPLVQEIKDLHTNLYLPGAFKKCDRVLPFKLYYDSERLYILENYSNQKQIKPGTEICSINNRTIKDITDQLVKYINVFDGEINCRYVFELQQTFALLYAEFIEQPSFFNLKTVYNKDTVVYLTGVLKKGDSVYTKVGDFDKIISSAYVEKPLMTSFCDSLDYAYLKINSFDFSLRYFFKLNKFFRKLRHSNYANLILDIRNNPGGNYALGGILIEKMFPSKFYLIDSVVVLKRGKIKVNRHDLLYYSNFKYGLKYDPRHKQFYRRDMQFKPNKNYYKGNLFVLTNHLTMSTSSMVAGFLKANKRAVVIGEETANNLYHFSAGGFIRFKLPNSRLSAQIPLALITNNIKSDEDLSRGVCPDVPVNLSVDDLLKNNDSQFYKAMDLIKKKQSGN